jgi:glycosyltransferase involved in cell wall biosynthesis
MRDTFGRIEKVAKKSSEIIKNDGVFDFSKRAVKYAYYRKFPEKKTRQFKDILFINGCTLPHPTRYRVDHQIEQLISNGLTADSVFYDQLSLDMLKFYRGFVFFRCPVTDTVRDFIAAAKLSNKKCFFDIDDLVIDTKYTDRIEYVSNMSVDDKRHYDDGVNRMQETLRLCDYAITTTERLRDELKGYIKKVHINRNVASDEMAYLSTKAIQEVKRDDSKLVIGYFSGSITHNEDFEIVLPSLVKLLEKYPELHLKVVGILDIPEALRPYKDRLINVGFMDWQSLPAELAECDINLAPLTDSIFNEAKSENKWIEAALVKVPTVASNLGAFKRVIKNHETGVLVSNDKWYDALDELLADKKKRTQIADAACHAVFRHHTTVYTGGELATFIRSKLARNIGFVLPSTDISGGVIVALKHAEVLKAAGWDVTLVDAVSKHALKVAKRQYQYRYDIPGHNIITAHKTEMSAYFDTLTATLWSTVSFIKKYPNVRNRLYFVQNYETDFYIPGTGEPRFLANASYSDESGVRYITMSLWCQRWLKERFGKEAKYCSNGINLDYYPFRERSFDTSKKIKILIEGDSKSEYKNTDEAFRIVEQLDSRKYEISYLSYRKEPKDWYRVDHFYNRIAPEKVGEIYAGCDILIKTSLVESFSYPPLEMMATGGVAVVVPNEGNVEYLRDGENCLFYEQGNIQAGVDTVERVISDKKLRNKLIANGRKTAVAYEWKNIEADIRNIYE